MSLVDIILPIFNPTEMVYYAIDSVLNQTYSNWHLYIVDDASKDNCLEDLKNKYIRYSEQFTYIKMEKNIRAAACRNYAIKQGKSKYIAFIDQDDIWSKNKLELQVQFIERHNLDAIHGNLEFINRRSEVFLNDLSEKENISRKCTKWDNQTDLARKLFLCPNIRLISSLITRKIYEKVNGFREEFFGGEDETFWFEVAKFGTIGYLDAILFYRREHDSNTYIKFKIRRLYGYLHSLKYIYKNYKNTVFDLYYHKRATIYYNILRYHKQNKSYGILLIWFTRAIIDYPYNFLIFFKIKKKQITVI